VNTGRPEAGSARTSGVPAARTTSSTRPASAAVPATSTGSPAAAIPAAAAPNRGAGYRRDAHDAPGTSRANRGCSPTDRGRDVVPPSDARPRRVVSTSSSAAAYAASGTRNVGVRPRGGTPIASSRCSDRSTWWVSSGGGVTQCVATPPANSRDCTTRVPIPASSPRCATGHGDCENEVNTSITS